MKPQLFVPIRILVFSLVVVLGAMIFMVSIAVQSPWLGLAFSVHSEHGIVISSVDKSGPAAGRLMVGQRVLALQGLNGPLILVNAETIIEEPDFFNDYVAYNAFFIQQSALHQALLKGAVIVHRDAGKPVTLIPQATRPLSALPFVFWFQIVCGLAAVVTGAFVWCFHPGDRSSVYYALTGVGLAVTIWTAAVYSGRELALDGELFHTLSLFDHFGGLFFCSAYCALLLNYPSQLRRRDWSWLIFALYFVFWLSDAMQWVPNMDISFRYPIYLGFAFSVWFSWCQWKNTHQNPIERAALKWFLFSLYVGCTLFITLALLPISLGREIPLSQGYSFGLIIAMYLGLLLGVLRYRLFNLERWWFRAWLWLLGGVLLTVVDMLLVVLLNMGPALALGVSLAVAGWGYMPLRNLLWQRFQPNAKGAEHYFGEIIQAIFLIQHPDEADRVWMGLLKKIYSPLSIKVENNAAVEPEVLENGLQLRLPSLSPDKSIILSYAQQGHRLFQIDDLELIKTLHFLTEQAVFQQNALAIGADRERSRIRRDLHDDLGAKLLTLLYKLKQPEDQAYVREALQDLREVVAALDQTPRFLADAFMDWGEEAQDRCSAAGVRLEWSAPEIDDSLKLDSRTQTNLRRVIREAITNALRHGQPSYIQVTLQLDGQQLCCQIVNDYINTPVADKEGRGKNNMRERITELGGHTSESVSPEISQYQINWELPIPTTGSADLS